MKSIVFAMAVLFSTACVFGQDATPATGCGCKKGCKKPDTSVTEKKDAAKCTCPEGQCTCKKADAEKK